MTLVDEPRDSALYTATLELYNAFVDWRLQQSDRYIPRHGLETMYAKGFLDETRTFFEEYPVDTEKDIKSDFSAFFLELRDKYPMPQFLTSAELHAVD